MNILAVLDRSAKYLTVHQAVEASLLSLGLLVSAEMSQGLCDARIFDIVHGVCEAGAGQ